MVLPSASMARKLVADIPEITVPQSWIDAIEDDRSAGVGHACELAHRIAESGAFDGVHLIPGVRYPETAARLEKWRIAEPAFWGDRKAPEMAVLQVAAQSGHDNRG